MSPCYSPSRVSPASVCRLEKTISKAKNEGGLELFLAYGQAYANPVPASFLIAEGSLGSAADGYIGFLVPMPVDWDAE